MAEPPSIPPPSLADGAAGRFRVLLEGTVGEVRIQPREALPRYEAELTVESSVRILTSDAARRAAHGEFLTPTSAIAMDADELEGQKDIVETGTMVRLIWHGQRTVPGIGAGTFLRSSGMLAGPAHQRVIFNPRYEIVSRPPARRTR